MFRSNRDAQAGFTLMELSVTAAILSILVAIAVTPVLKIFKKMEARQIASSLVTFISVAKQDALVYQNSIIACIATEQLQCVRSGGQHLISFIDKNNNHTYDAAVDQLNHHEDLAMRFGSLTASVSLNKPYIELKPDNGRPIGSMGNIRYCPFDGDVEHTFKVTFNKTGIVKHRTFQQEAIDCI